MKEAKSERWKKEALVLFKKEMENEILKELEEEIGEDAFREIKSRIKDKLKNEVQVQLQERIKDFKEEIAREIIAKKKEKVRAESFQRLSLNQRIQHIFLFSSVIILIITGLPLKFPEVSWAEWMMHLLGGIQNSTLMHRVGAVGLIGVSIYHLFYTILSRQGRHDFFLLLPRPKDLFDALTNIKHFMGRSERRPRFGRFSYIEKFDYWAVYWGCIIMIGSGFFLWFEELTMRFFPKFVIDISHEAHSDEALLATLAIVIWHFYNVHFNPSKFPGSLLWWHGKINKEEMIEEHPLEYEKNTGEKVPVQGGLDEYERFLQTRLGRFFSSQSEKWKLIWQKKFERFVKQQEESEGSQEADLFREKEEE